MPEPPLCRNFEKALKTTRCPSSSLKNAARGTERGATLWPFRRVCGTGGTIFPAQEQSSKIQIPKPNSNNKAIPDCNLNSESLWIVLVFVSRGRSLWIKLFTSVPPTRLQSATTTASARYSLACTSAARARLWQSSLRLACRAPVAHLRPSPLSYEQIPQATP